MKKLEFLKVINTIIGMIINNSCMALKANYKKLTCLKILTFNGMLL